MQIVIDISEDFYKEIKMYGNMSVIHKAVLDGKVLPKGHGRLIDADNLDDVYVAYDCNGILSRIDAPTILEPTETKAKV